MKVNLYGCMFRTRTLLVCILFYISTLAIAQPKLLTLNNESGSESVFTHQVDSNGNYYVYGVIKSRDVDFNPSDTAVYSLSSSNRDGDLFIAKYAANGSFQWVFKFGGVGVNTPTAIEVKGDYLYVAGKFKNSFDADPSTGITSLHANFSSSSIGASSFLIKYNIRHSPVDTAFLEWATIWGGSTSSGLQVSIMDLEVQNGFIYIAGWALGSSMDLDPTANTHLLSTGSGCSFFVKLNNQYTPNDTLFYKWGGRLGNFTNKRIKVNNSHIYLSGTLSGTTPYDMNPASGVNSITGVGSKDVFLAKYSDSFPPDSNSFFQSAFCFGTAGEDMMNQLELTDSHLYVVGYLGGNCDMDPSSKFRGTNFYWGHKQAFLVKYNITKQFSDTNFFESAFGIAPNASDSWNEFYDVSVSGHEIYVSGFIESSPTSPIDVDPSSKVVQRDGVGILAKYDGSKSPLDTTFLQWAKVFPGLIGCNSIEVHGSRCSMAGYFKSDSLNFNADASIPLIGSSGNASNSQSGFLSSYGSSSGIISSLITIGNKGGITYGMRVLSKGTDKFIAAGTFNGIQYMGFDTLTGPGTYVTQINASTGIQDWVFSIRSNFSDIKVEGNYLYVAYTFGAKTDIDPSSDTAFFGNAGENNLCIARYNLNYPPTSIDFYDWAFVVKLPNTSFRFKFNLATTGSNLYLSGYYAGNSALDVDPSSGIYNIPASVRSNTFLVKYDVTQLPTASTFIKWGFTLPVLPDNSSSSIPSGASVTVKGNDIYLYGVIEVGTSIDLNPSSNVFNISNSGDYDVFLAKYDAGLTPSDSSFFKWAFKIGSAGRQYPVDIDIEGNKLLLGMQYAGTVDFDPSAKTVNLTASAFEDIGIACYDLNYSPSDSLFLKWVFGIGSVSSTSNAETVYDVLLKDSFLYIGGHITGTADMNPASAVSSVSTPMVSAFVCKYDYRYNPNDSLFYQWAYVHHSENSSYVQQMAINNGLMATTGFFRGFDVDFDPNSSSTLKANSRDGSSFILVNSSVNPLPVEWLYCKAKWEGEDAIVNWATSSEKNNRYFTVEFSYDGVHFEQAGEVQSKSTNGFSSVILHYDFNDYLRKEKTIDDVFYRVKQTDMNGDFAYSNVVVLKKDFSSVSSVIVFPNPARNTLNIKASEKEYKVECWGIDGRKYLQTYSFAPETSLKTDQLPVGIYFIQVRNSISGDIVGVEKVVIER
ncbi:MAG: T9SS type A sorting domain-containing protein [Bacteroidia bacterium]|nr:T9SS type A sorting domain-containing protein [Bacteroidia bacterium]MBP7260214.1 T9SS type A sorting domain-containing protein [Bacteroidia bacterium]MBP9179821.1 T9SS type A sorting domain-containing protein [Bacteroidia bacterium]